MTVERCGECVGSVTGYFGPTETTDHDDHPYTVEESIFQWTGKQSDVKQGDRLGSWTVLSTDWSSYVCRGAAKVYRVEFDCEHQIEILSRRHDPGCCSPDRIAKLLETFTAVRVEAAALATTDGTEKLELVIRFYLREQQLTYFDRADTWVWYDDALYRMIDIVDRDKKKAHPYVRARRVSVDRPATCDCEQLKTVASAAGA